MSRLSLAPPPWVGTVLLPLTCLALVLALYRPALDLYFVGDDIAFVHPNPDWLRTALLPGGEWHYYPLTQAGFALLGMATDWQPWPLHLLNLLLHIQCYGFRNMLPQKTKKKMGKRNRTKKRRRRRRRRRRKSIL